jgi:colanic acid/amylovoran biosynthesis protein
MELPKNCPLICLLGASFATNNLGVSALATGAINGLKRAMPSARITMLDYARKPSCISVLHDNLLLPIEVINTRFSWKIFLRNNILLLIILALCARMGKFAGFYCGVLEWNSAFKEIRSVDLFVALSGGDSFTDLYGLGRLWYVSLPQFLVILLQKPLVQLPQTYGPFTGLVSKAVARGILSNSTLIYSRDAMGICIVNRHGGSLQSTRFCYDVAFGMEPRPPKERELEAFRGLLSRHELVGLNISGLLWMGGYDRQNMFGLRIDYKRLISEIIELLVGSLNSHVVLLPHVVGGSENAESDEIPCSEILAQTNAKYKDRIHVLLGPCDHQEIKYLIGNCGFFIGSRMHACIAAISQGVPAISLAYSAKFAGVMESVSAQDLVWNLYESSIESVLDGIALAFERRSIIKNRLLEKMPEVKAKLEESFLEVARNIRNV